MLHPPPNLNPRAQCLVAQTEPQTEPLRRGLRFVCLFVCFLVAQYSGMNFMVKDIRLPFLRSKRRMFMHMFMKRHPSRSQLHLNYCFPSRMRRKPTFSLSEVHGFPPFLNLTQNVDCVVKHVGWVPCFESSPPPSCGLLSLTFIRR